MGGNLGFTYGEEKPWLGIGNIYLSVYFIGSNYLSIYLYIYLSIKFSTTLGLSCFCRHNAVWLKYKIQSVLYFNELSQRFNAKIRTELTVLSTIKELSFCHKPGADIRILAGGVNIFYLIFFPPPPRKISWCISNYWF